MNNFYQTAKVQPQGVDWNLFDFLLISAWLCLQNCGIEKGIYYHMAMA